jgi:hypothetical protein
MTPPKRDRPPTLDEMRAEVEAEQAAALEAARTVFRTAFRAEMAELDETFLWKAVRRKGAES